jgi:hypothetical protein
MPQNTNEAALAITQGIEELNEALAQARKASAPPTELALELLTTIVSGAITFALLPGAAAGIGVLGAVAGVSAALSSASSILTATILTFELFGARKMDVEAAKFVGRFTGNPFSVTLGTIGMLIDGEYGFETGITAGELVEILYDLHDLNEVAMQGEEKTLHPLSKTISVPIHFTQLAKELREFPPTPEAQHPLSSRHQLQEELNAYSMAKNLIESPIRVAKPAVAMVTDRPSVPPSVANADYQIKLDRLIFGAPTDPIYTPVVQHPMASVTPRPTPRLPKGIPNAPSAPTSTADSGTIRVDTPLLPDYLGGSEPSDPDNPPPGDTFVPSVTTDDTIQQLP